MGDCVTQPPMKILTILCLEELNSVSCRGIAKKSFVTHIYTKYGKKRYI
jgi:hypothetical protein